MCLEMFPRKDLPHYCLLSTSVMGTPQTGYTVLSVELLASYMCSSCFYRVLSWKCTQRRKWHSLRGWRSMRRNEFSRYVTSFESVKGKGRLQKHIVSAGFWYIQQLCFRSALTIVVVLLLFTCLLTHLFQCLPLLSLQSKPIVNFLINPLTHVVSYSGQIFGSDF